MQKNFQELPHRMGTLALTVFNLEYRHSRKSFYENPGRMNWGTTSSSIEKVKMEREIEDWMKMLEAQCFIVARE